MASPLINVMSQAALKAAKGLQRDFGEVDKLQISRKGTSNFVTQTDLRAEKVIHAELSKARPGYGFLMEESGEIKGKDSEYRWVVDPLDGTSNFIHAIPYFCISIALERFFDNGKSEVVAGVIYDPIHNELFAAEKRMGATLNDHRISASRRSKLDECMLVTSIPRNATPEGVEAFAMLGRVMCDTASVRHSGATALDLAYLACGRYDACWYTRQQPWDVAAGLLIIQEAGGLVTQCDGKPHTSESSTLLACNPEIAGHITKLLAVNSAKN